MTEQSSQKSELMQHLIAAASDAFVRLPEGQQQVLTLAVDSNLTVPAIAETMDLSDGDVRRSMRSALQTLFEAVNQAASTSEIATKEQSA